MRVLEVVGPGRTEMVERPIPQVGPGDVLVEIGACGICGTDLHLFGAGTIPIAPDLRRFPIGHEPAGRVVEAGPAVADLPVGAQVVINPMAPDDGVIGTGGSQGALSEYLLIRDAVRGRDLELIDDTVPIEVAALNEPMAVARHLVNRAAPDPGQSVLIFGAGAIGLGATIWLKLLGVKHVAVVDLEPTRLRRAERVGADAVFDGRREDLAEWMLAVHGEGRDGLGLPRGGTDIYIDAAGSQAVFDRVLGAAKLGARLAVAGIPTAPVPLDLGALVMSEVTLVGSLGYPEEIFQVTGEIAANWRTFAEIIGETVPFDRVEEMLATAGRPGGPEKVVVTFGR